ncbi:MAG: hypothetical protein CVU84_04990 [Firmicutes bacterium HGW-Firmicutes-1]|jgi:RND family efflux transporter MFP subunit|nr:MAG: hypothetical protein CVU84_04990 [Firmicutes bacterium HGW-Firmicutes-1]
MKRTVLSLKSTLTLAIILGLASITILTSGCQKSAAVAATEEKYTPVKTEKAIKGPIEKSMTYAGYLKPLKSVDVSSKSMGTIDRIFFDVGDQVKDGELLFIMDKKNASNNLIILENQMDTQANQLESSLKAAELQFNDAKNMLDDMTVLLSEGIIANQQFEDTKIRYEQAKLAYETAKQSYDLFFNDPSKSSFAAQINIAKDGVKDHEVRSPISGIVAQRNIEEGELAGNQPAFTIVKLDKLILEINVPESVISKITLNQQVQVKVKMQGDEIIIGKVIEISPTVDKRTFTYPIKVEIDNEAGLLKDGMYAEVSIVIEKNDEALLINRNALLLDNIQKYIYVVENQMAKRVDIEMGVDNGTKVEILKGLVEGQEVIIKGQDYLTNGEKIQIVQ